MRQYWREPVQTGTRLRGTRGGTDAQALSLDVATAMAELLTEQEQAVLRLRYGLGGAVPVDITGTATALGLSRSMAWRIERRALAKLGGADSLL